MSLSKTNISKGERNNNFIVKISDTLWLALTLNNHVDNMQTQYEMRQATCFYEHSPKTPLTPV